MQVIMNIPVTGCTGKT